MRKWNVCKNVMLSLAITGLFANWSTKQLHECNIFLMWTILITVAVIAFLLLRESDKEFMKLDKERRKKRNEKIARSSKQIESTKE